MERPVLQRMLRHGPCAQRLLSTSSVVAGRAPARLLALSQLAQQADHNLTRDWIDGFTLDDLPKDGYAVTYARSSGPGGQHVNKTNSKAVVRCDVNAASGVWLPPFVAAALRKTPHYHPPSLLISSQNSRKAPDNLARALEILHASIVDTTRGMIVGETSEEQKERVQGHVEADQRRRRMAKEKMKNKKANRKADW
ncbi:uncharacterized protein LOC62_03G004458 [Vanrija pseudolonga]|uniref:Prokaryotic-type class I peptide chain release factors domain-containing protein n=1 Tax=Vanrija pseudolonga TaxID=143232 RepID=A0AAF0YA15_9TREE|nr:hypothetical protein LOC62_03G004458 [Vanrija pseudolonga]